MLLDNHAWCVDVPEVMHIFQVSAATILKSLVKNVDPEIVGEMEVAAGKYVIQDGSVKILSRSWYANRTYYCTLES